MFTMRNSIRIGLVIGALVALATETIAYFDAREPNTAQVVGQR